MRRQLVLLPSWSLALKKSVPMPRLIHQPTRVAMRAHSKRTRMPSLRGTTKTKRLELMSNTPGRRSPRGHPRGRLRGRRGQRCRSRLQQLAPQVLGETAVGRQGGNRNLCDARLSVAQRQT